jgi:hypothetical protein
VLQSGDQFRLGRHLFRFDLGIPVDSHADSREAGQTGATRELS